MANDVMVPRSRISLTYDTRQPDQPRLEKELPFRLLVVGDLSGRASKKAEADGKSAAVDELENRAIHHLNGNNIDSIMSKMNIALTLKNLPDVVNDGQFDLTELPLRSMASFEPGQIVEQLEPAKRLIRVRELVLKAEGLLQNNKQFVRLLRELAANGDSLASLQQKFEGLDGKLRVAPDSPAKPQASSPQAKAASSGGGQAPQTNQAH